MMDPNLALALQAVLIGAAIALALFPPLGASRPRSAAAAHDAPTPPPPPPFLPGLPVLGNAIALGRAGAAVLLAARRDKRFGDCFAVRAFPAAPPLVFVFHPRAVTSFFAAPEDVLSFKPAVRRFTERVFGLPADEFSASHEPLLDALRALLSPPERLRAHAAAIAERAAPMLDAWADGDTDEAQQDLWPLARTLVFRAAGGALFGDAFFARGGGAERVERLFLDFEGGFERAASPVPHALLPAFSAARKELLRVLRASLDAGDLDGTVAGELAARSGVRAELRPNLLLSVLWASQANSLPAFFWALAFLLQPGEGQAWLERVRGAVGQHGRAAAAAGSTPGGPAFFPEIDAALDPSGPAQRAANEAIRARAHSIAIRLVPFAQAKGGRAGGFDVPVDVPAAASAPEDAATTTATTAVVRAPPGSVLAVCPYATHADPRFFSPRPEAFDPSRPPTPALPGFGVGMAFGSGSWRCPGRLFAGMELGLLLSMAATRLEIRPVAADAKAEGRAPTNKKRLWWERAAVALLGEARAMYGLGVGLDAEAYGAELAPACPSSALPPADVKRLVGFKVPARPLMVRVSRRRRGGDEDAAPTS